MCRKEDFQGFSLVSVVYNAMCLIVQERLVKVVEEKQGRGAGWHCWAMITRRRKGCWLHLLILRGRMLGLIEPNYGAAWKELG